MANKKTIVFSVAVMMSVGFGGKIQASLTLPDSSLALQYGDFYSYSLPLLQYLSDNGFIPTASYSTDSSPGIIKDGVVIGTGSTGNPVTTNFNGMNDAYDMPGPGSGEFFDFSDATNDPGNSLTAPVADSTTSWNADVAALSSFLAAGGGDLAIFFNLNETGTPALGDEGLASTDLLGWAVVTLSTPLANGLDPQKKFFFSAFDNPFTVADERTPGLTDSIANGGPEADPSVDPTGTSFDTLDSRWGIAHSALTVNPATGSLIGFGPVGGGDQINQNLGANEAAFVVFNEELDALIKAGAYRDFSLEFRESRINNGFEQIFLLNDTVVTRRPPEVVPEPGSLAVWSLMIGMGCLVSCLWIRKSRGD